MATLLLTGCLDAGAPAGAPLADEPTGADAPRDVTWRLLAIEVDAWDDQGPGPRQTDLWGSLLETNGTHLAFNLVLDNVTLDQSRVHYEVWMIAESWRHVIDCYVGTPNPIQGGTAWCDARRMPYPERLVPEEIDWYDAHPAVTVVSLPIGGVLRVEFPASSLFEPGTLVQLEAWRAGVAAGVDPVVLVNLAPSDVMEMSTQFVVPGRGNSA